MLDRVLRADDAAAQQRAQKLMHKLEIRVPANKARFLLKDWKHTAPGTIVYVKSVEIGSKTTSENTHTPRLNGRQMEAGWAIQVYTKH